MAIPILTPSEQDAMRRAGRAAAATLDAVAALIQPGLTTADIDAFVRADTVARGGLPSQLGYHGFPAAVCTSRNHVGCHGIPRVDEVLAPGDIVNVDVTTNLDGFHGDTSRTFYVGEPDADARRVVEAARACLRAGLAVVRDGVRLGAIGRAVVAEARRHGCAVVPDIAGHGIGRYMHQAPDVLHVPAGRGPRLRAGMAITIEPLVTLGEPTLDLLPDGWTLVTRDGAWSAQFEHTVLVTRTGCEVLTRAPDVRTSPTASPRR